MVHWEKPERNQHRFAFIFVVRAVRFPNSDIESHVSTATCFGPADVLSGKPTASINGLICVSTWDYGVQQTDYAVQQTFFIQYGTKKYTAFYCFLPVQYLIIYLYSNKLHSIDIFINNILKYLYCLKL